MTELFNLRARVAPQGPSARSEKVGQAMSGGQPGDALEQLRGISKSLTSDKGAVRSGFLRLLNSSHANQDLKLEQHGRLFMAFHGSRNKETAQALLTLAQRAGLDDAALLNYLQTKVNTGAKIRIATLEGHLKRALPDALNPGRGSAPGGLLAGSFKARKGDELPSPLERSASRSNLSLPQVPEENQGQDLQMRSSPRQSGDLPHLDSGLPKPGPVVKPRSESFTESNLGQQEPPPGDHSSALIAEELPIRFGPQGDDLVFDDSDIDDQNPGFRRSMAGEDIDGQQPEEVNDPFARHPDRPSSQDRPSMYRSEERHSSFHLPDERGPSIKLPREPSGSQISESQALSPQEQARAADYDQFLKWLTEGSDVLESARTMMGRGQDGATVLPVFQPMHESVLAFTGRLDDLREIERRFDGSAALNQELIQTRQAMEPAIRYFKQTLEDLESRLPVLRESLEEFAPELAGDDPLRQECEDLEQGLTDLQTEFNELLQQAEPQLPHPDEIRSRQKALRDQDYKDFSREYKRLIPQAEQSFSSSAVVKPRIEEIKRLISNALASPTSAKFEELVAQEKDLQARLGSAEALLSQIRAADQGRAALLRRVAEQFPGNPELMQSYDAFVRHQAVNAGFTNNKARLEAAIAGFKGALNDLANAQSRVEDLLSKQVQSGPIDVRIRELTREISQTLKKEPGAAALDSLSLQLEGITRVIRGLPDMGHQIPDPSRMPDERQRQVLREFLSQHRGVLTEMIRQGCEAQLADELAPLKARLDQQLQARDDINARWMSMNNDLVGQLDSAQAQLQAALDHFKDRQVQRDDLVQQARQLNDLIRIESEIQGAADEEAAEPLRQALEEAFEKLDEPTRDRLLDLGSAASLQDELEAQAEALSMELTQISNAAPKDAFATNISYWQALVEQAQLALADHQASKPVPGAQEGSETRAQINRAMTTAQEFREGLLGKLQALQAELEGA